MKYLVKDLEQILNAKKINIVENKEITGIAIDSRKVKEGDLFIPFLGENVDGHNYIESAFEKGAAASLSLKEIPKPHRFWGLLRYRCPSNPYL